MREILLALILIASPTVHRSPEMPAQMTFNGYALTRHAELVEKIIPENAGPVFVLGNALILHLAHRQGYWRQNHQWWVAFTAEDQPKYRRMGLWGQSDMRVWLRDSKYAIVDDVAWNYFMHRPPFAKTMQEMGRLLSDYQPIAHIGTWTIYEK